MNPESINYDFMQEPAAQPVTCGLPSTTPPASSTPSEQQPDDLHRLPGPGRPDAGRGFMPVIVGLGVPADAPNPEAGAGPHRLSDPARHPGRGPGPARPSTRWSTASTRPTCLPEWPDRGRHRGRSRPTPPMPFRRCCRSGSAIAAVRSTRSSGAPSTGSCSTAKTSPPSSTSRVTCPADAVRRDRRSVLGSRIRLGDGSLRGEPGRLIAGSNRPPPDVGPRPLVGELPGIDRWRPGSCYDLLTSTITMRSRWQLRLPAPTAPSFASEAGAVLADRPGGAVRADVLCLADGARGSSCRIYDDEAVLPLLSEPEAVARRR